MRNLSLVTVVVGAHLVFFGAALMFGGCSHFGSNREKGGVLYPPGDERAAPKPIPVDPTPAVRPPKPPPGKPWEERYTLYKVVKGDTLSGIAHRYDVGMRDIMQLSQIADPGKLLIGQVVKLPGKINLGAANEASPSGANVGPPESPPVPSTPAPRVTVPPDGKTYVVQKGDVLSRIAARHGVKTKQLVKVNNLKDADTIRVGQKLRIPGTGGAGTPPPPPRDSARENRPGDNDPSLSPVTPPSEDRPAERFENLKPPSDTGDATEDGTSDSASEKGTTEIAGDGAQIVTLPTGEKCRVVKALDGDDIFALAIRWKASPIELKEINNLKDKGLTTGQKVLVPINE